MAVEWYEKAAKQGYANAQYPLGAMYHLGHGVDVNYKRRRSSGTRRRQSRDSQMLSVN